MSTRLGRPGSESGRSAEGRMLHSPGTKPWFLVHHTDCSFAAHQDAALPFLKGCRCSKDELSARENREARLLCSTTLVKFLFVEINEKSTFDFMQTSQCYIVALAISFCSLGLGSWSVHLENIKCSLQTIALKVQGPRSQIWMSHAFEIFPLFVFCGFTLNDFADGW